MASSTTKTGVEPYLCLPYHTSPAGFPISKRGAWNPTIGSGPFMVDRVPTNMPLSHGAMCVLVFCAEKRMFGLTTASLSRFQGFDNNGRIKKGITNLSGSKKDKKHQVKQFGMTIRDVAGELITLNGVVMTGNRDEDQGTPAGNTNENNFKKQKGDREMWWSQIVYGATTQKASEAKDFAMSWRSTVSINATDANHASSVCEYDARMYQMASARVKAGVANPLEVKFVLAWDGEGSDTDEGNSSEESESEDEIPIADERIKKSISQGTLGSKDAANQLLVDPLIGQSNDTDPELPAAELLANQHSDQDIDLELFGLPIGQSNDTDPELPAAELLDNQHSGQEPEPINLASVRLPIDQELELIEAKRQLIQQQLKEREKGKRKLDEGSFDEDPAREAKRLKVEKHHQTIGEIRIIEDFMGYLIQRVGSCIMSLDSEEEKEDAFNTVFFKFETKLDEAKTRIQGGSSLSRVSPLSSLTDRSICGDGERRRFLVCFQ